MKDLKEGDITYPFGILPFPQNRHNKHAAEKVSKLIGDVQNKFLDQLFNDDSLEYGELYEYYLMNFTRIVNYIQHTVKPKYIQLDPQYFALTFRPLEK